MVKKQFKKLVVTTVDGTVSYHGPDGEAVFQALVDANMNGLSHTFPIHLDDSESELIYGLNAIVSAEKYYYIKED